MEYRLFGFFCFINLLGTSFCKRVNFSTPDSMAGVLDMQGMRGSVEFFSQDFTAPNINWTIRVNFFGPIPGERFKWMIYELPPRLHETDPCNEKKLGRAVVDLTELFGYVQAGEDKVVQSTTSLKHVRGLFERTLVLKGIQTPRRLCAPILSSHSVSTYEARLFRNVGGYFAFRQTGIETGIRSHLYWTNGVGRDTKLRWSIARVRDSAPANVLDPRSWSGNCALRRGDVVSQVIQTDKPVSVGEIANVNSWSYYLDFSLYSSFNFGKWWVILYPHNISLPSGNPGEYAGCAMIQRVEPKQAIAILEPGGEVKGFVRFYQESPYGDPTLISVNLSIPKSNAGGFGIDEFPLVPGMDVQNKNCSRLRLRYFDPLQVDVDVIPQPSTGTTDQFQIGDLSGKLGPLLGQRSVVSNYYDQYLTLFDTNSVVGRSIVVYSANWEPLACTNVELTEADIIVAIAAFHSPLVGLVLFKQAKGRRYADTSVYVELYHGDPEKSTQGHILRIPSLPLFIPVGNSTSDCAHTGSTFDPLEVSNTSALYRFHCKPDAALSCKMGDLAGKFGRKIDVPGASSYSETAIGRYYYTDVNLPLHGIISVAGRPLTISPENGTEDDGPIACSNIVVVSASENEPNAREYTDDLF